jgi:hypothetical protein
MSYEAAARAGLTCPAYLLTLRERTATGAFAAERLAAKAAAAEPRRMAAARVSNAVLRAFTAKMYAPSQELQGVSERGHLVSHLLRTLAPEPPFLRKVHSVRSARPNWAKI